MAYDSSGRSWRPTSAPLDSCFTEDLWFADPEVGWAVNSNSQILHTTDGGEQWQQQAHLPDAYLRCVSFAGIRVGWVGTLTSDQRLFRTENGGETWEEATNLPVGAPLRIAGLSVNGERTVFVAGSTYPDEAASIAYSHDAGSSWTAVDLSRQAATLSDVLFTDAQRGWVVGARSLGDEGRRGDLAPVVLKTDDGGATWRDALSSVPEATYLGGEVASRICAVRPQTLVVTLDSDHGTAVLRSDDGGVTWVRNTIASEPRHLEGVGFADRDHGWIGGHRDVAFVNGQTLATSDGGATWQVAGDAGLRLSRLRFVGHPDVTGYASGDTIHRYGANPATYRPAGMTAARALRVIETHGVASFSVDVPAGASDLVVACWERRGRIVRRILRESRPQEGRRAITWDLAADDGTAVPAGIYIIRATVDGRSESRMVFKTR